MTTRETVQAAFILGGIPLGVLLHVVTHKAVRRIRRRKWLRDVQLGNIRFASYREMADV